MTNLILFPLILPFYLIKFKAIPEKNYEKFLHISSTGMNKNQICSFHQRRKIQSRKRKDNQKSNKRICKKKVTFLCGGGIKIRRQTRESNKTAMK